MNNLLSNEKHVMNMDISPINVLKMRQITWRNRIRRNGRNPEGKRLAEKKQHNLRDKAKTKFHPQHLIQSLAPPTKGNPIKTNTLNWLS
jgi:hypothetical protein